MGEIKAITFHQFNISIFTSFWRSPPPLSSKYTSILKPQELINNLLNLQTTYPIAMNKSDQRFITDIVKLK